MKTIIILIIVVLILARLIRSYRRFYVEYKLSYEVQKTLYEMRTFIEAKETEAFTEQDLLQIHSLKDTISKCNTEWKAEIQQIKQEMKVSIKEAKKKIDQMPLSAPRIYPFDPFGFNESLDMRKDMAKMKMDAETRLEVNRTEAHMLFTLARLHLSYSQIFFTSVRPEFKVQLKEYFARIESTTKNFIARTKDKKHLCVLSVSDTLTFLGEKERLNVMLA